METCNTSLFSLKGKNVLITGGAGILGQRFAQGLAAFGADLAIVDLDLGAASETAAAVAAEHGVRAVGIRCDVSDKADVEAMMVTFAQRLGPVHVLLNNAASKSSDLDAFFAPFEEFSLETWREVMSVNIDGMFLVAQAVGRDMVSRGTVGSIIQTSSIYGHLAPDQRIYQGSSYNGRAINTPAVYAASKAAIIGLTRYLASYWGAQQIRVNTLIPGGVESGQNELFNSRYSNRVPLGRMARPDDMVGAVVFLASDASSYVTGQNMIVDGGLSAW